MYTIWVLALALGSVSADIGIGYHYKVPETTYGVPSFQIGNSGKNSGFSVSSSKNLGSISSTGYSGHGFSTISPAYTGHGFSTVSPGYAGHGFSTVSPVYAEHGFSTVSPIFSSSSNTDYSNGYASGVETGLNYAQANTGGTGFNYNTQGFNSAYKYNGLGSGLNQGFFEGSSGQNLQSGLNGYYQPSLLGGSDYYNQYQTAAVNKYQEYYNQIVQQPPQVFKHFYVHAAPEEPPVAKPRQPIVLPPAQKHYKIIFIKAPEQQAPAPQIIPVQSQNEEKTIVYVLVKNPEDVQNVVLPKFEPKPPTKPEVFFIKYDDKQDSQAVINNIVNDYDKGGISASFAGLGTEYVGIKGSGPSGVIGGVSSGGFGSGSSGSSSGFSSGTSGSSSGFSSGLGGSTIGIGSGSSGSSGGFGSGSSGSSSGFSSLTSGSTGGFGSSTGGSGISDGSFAVASTSSGNGFGGTVTKVENQGSSSFESQFTSSGPTIVTSSGSENSFNNGLERIFGTPVTPVSIVTSTPASSLVSFESSSISTSQGVPHESYGVPKFKEV